MKITKFSNHVDIIIIITLNIAVLASFSSANLTCSSTSPPESVCIYWGNYFSDSKFNNGFHGQPINISTCTKTIPESKTGKLSLIYFQGNCLNLYLEQWNCGGRFIRYFPGAVDPVVNPFQHFWVNGRLVKQELNFKSIGPCYDKCDPRNWLGSSRSPVKVTLYDREEYKGNSAELTIQGDGCFEISGSSEPNKSYESIAISGNQMSSCIELHSAANCDGHFTQLRPGYPELNDLWFYGLGGGNSARKAKAISRCGAMCAVDEWKLVETMKDVIDVEEEQSDKLPVWGTILITLSVLVVLFGVAGCCWLYLERTFCRTHTTRYAETKVQRNVRP